MDTNTPAGGNHVDLLSAILNIKVHHDEKISQQDHSFCQTQLEALNKTLTQLEEWYGYFREKSTEEQYLRYNPQYKDNGSVEFNNHYRYYANNEGAYQVWFR